MLTFQASSTTSIMIVAFLGLIEYPYTYIPNTLDSFAFPDSLFLATDHVVISCTLKPRPFISALNVGLLLVSPRIRFLRVEILGAHPISEPQSRLVD